MFAYMLDEKDQPPFFSISTTMRPVYRDRLPSIMQSGTFIDRIAIVFFISIAHHSHHVA